MHNIFLSYAYVSNIFFVCNQMFSMYVSKLQITNISMENLPDIVSVIPMAILGVEKLDVLT